MTVDFRSYEARKAGKSLEMTRREFQILRALASRPGEVVTRDELLDQVWGLDLYPTTRTVDNHIAAIIGIQVIRVRVMAAPLNGAPH